MNLYEALRDASPDRAAIADIIEQEASPWGAADRIVGGMYALLAAVLRQAGGEVRVPRGALIDNHSIERFEEVDGTIVFRLLAAPTEGDTP